MYMSLHFIRINNNHLQVVGAGMPPILYYQSSIKNIMEIESGGPPLGGFPNFKYKLYKYDLSKGDIIVVLTDGFAERMNIKKEILGWDKGTDLLKRINYSAADEIIKEFVNTSDVWGGQRQQDDDITFVVFKVK